jgi:two-component system sensor histidine kinase DegS
VRELLFNIVKHARADRIKILALKNNNKIRINIEDDGVGFNASKVRFSVNELNGFGLFSIRERMEHFGGQFDIKSKSGRGTNITLVMPLTQQKGAAGAER